MRKNKSKEHGIKERERIEPKAMIRIERR